MPAALIWGCQDPATRMTWIPARVDSLGRLMVVTEAAAYDCGVAAGGANTVCVDTTKSWGINMWAGAYIQVTIGGVEYHRQIVSNIADRLTFDPLPALVVVAAGDPYCIVAGLAPTAPTVIIDPYTDAAGANIVPAVVRSTAIGAFRAIKVQIHWAAATSNPVTIALDANAGPAYDTVLRTVTMGANTDLIYYFPESALFEAGDVITVAWANDIGVLAWAVQIGWME